MKELLARASAGNETSPPPVGERFHQKLMLQKSFVDFFSNAGFINLPSVNVFSPDVDPTVDFIGSSTNVFKDYLINRQNRPRKDIPNPGLFLYQPKLRAQNGKAFYKERPIDLLTHFVGGGILMPPGLYEQVCNVTTEFLFSLGLTADDLLVKVFSGHPELRQFWELKNPYGLSYELVTKNEDEYLWDYGEPGLTGRGIIFAVKSGVENKPKDFSTLTIINHFNKEIGIEWGFGSEVLLSSFYDLPHPISYSTIFEANPFLLEGQDTIKLSDTLTAVVFMIDSGVSYQKKDRTRGSNVLIKYMKALSYYLRETNTPLGTLREWVQFLTSKEFNSNPETYGMVVSYIEKTRESEFQFAKAVVMAVHGNYLPLESFEGVKRMLRENQKVDIVNLAFKYYDHFEDSNLLKSIKNSLLEGRYLTQII
jgi:hypothetical protein